MALLHSADCMYNPRPFKLDLLKLNMISKIKMSGEFALMCNFNEKASAPTEAFLYLNFVRLPHQVNSDDTNKSASHLRSVVNSL